MYGAMHLAQGYGIPAVPAKIALTVSPRHKKATLTACHATERSLAWKWPSNTPSGFGDIQVKVS